MANNVSDKIFDNLGDILYSLVFIVPILFGLIVIGWQVYTWLRIGAWPSLPFSEAFIYFNVNLTNIYYPSDWQGLAKIAQWVLNLPLSICVPVLIILFAKIIKECD